MHSPSMRYPRIIWREYQRDHHHYDFDNDDDRVDISSNLFEDTSHNYALPLQKFYEDAFYIPYTLP